MLPSASRNRSGVASLLQRSAQYLSGLLHSVTHAPPASCPSSLGFGLPSLVGKDTCGREGGRQQRQLVASLRSIAAAHCQLDAKWNVAELQASLLAALFPKPHRNNSVTHVMESHALAALEKDVSDSVAALLHLPPRFYWAPQLGVRADEKIPGLADPPLPHSRHSPFVPAASYTHTSTVRATGSHGDSGGGGLLHSTSLESLIVLLTTARAQAHARYLSAHFSSPEDEARLTQQLVLYCSDQCQPLLRKAARCVGIHHIRTLQTVYSPLAHNYPMQVDMLKAALAEDVAQGLYPLLVCGVFGSRTTGAVDPLDQLAELCRRVKVWFHIDASHSGLALVASANAHSVQQQQRETEPGAQSAAMGEWNAAAEAAWQQHASAFRRAAATADSIHVGVSTSFLPTLSAVSPASLLYVADVAKVGVALQRMHSEDETGANGWCTPAATDVSRLRLENPEMRSRDIITLALTLMQRREDGCIRHAVREHQAALRYLEQRLRADGRFDCAVHASCFGMVLLRWLTLADEETAALMRRCSNILAARHAASDDEGGRRPPRVSLGLTRIQRRLHICVSLSPSTAADGDDTDDSGECLSRHDVDFFVDVLREAAAGVSGATDTLPS
ncbi:tyrosine decarboxylase [Trypanosoma grayi]|uniref:tyrosine decarboxylase n=1 Tax=Trypanosoma grayi TaxID=71804 RepID=UPI0004F4BC8E|nr:tyrosine decarboxylase [Trypanosoma grayi]KEG11096.1 tyrosine decarboxylase [Trypanosoma grayi]